MDKRSLVLLTVATFLTFLALLSTGIGISARHETSELESRITDVEDQIKY